MLIPYNAYRLHGERRRRPRTSCGRHHIEPELARYELHRVWVVQATLKPGAKHVYSRRVFYVDEDSWQIAVAESYDLQGRLWRVNEAHAINYYDVPVLWSTLEVYHDLAAESLPRRRVSTTTATPIASPREAIRASSAPTRSRTTSASERRLGVHGTGSEAVGLSSSRMRAENAGS